MIATASHSAEALVLPGSGSNDSDSHEEDWERESDGKSQRPSKIDGRAKGRDLLRDKDAVVSRTVVEQTSPPVGRILPL